MSTLNETDRAARVIYIQQQPPTLDRRTLLSGAAGGVIVLLTQFLMGRGASPEVAAQVAQAATTGSDKDKAAAKQKVDSVLGPREPLKFDSLKQAMKLYAPETPNHDSWAEDITHWSWAPEEEGFAAVLADRPRNVVQQVNVEPSTVMQGWLRIERGGSPRRQGDVIFNNNAMTLLLHPNVRTIGLNVMETQGGIFRRDGNVDALFFEILPKAQAMENKFQPGTLLIPIAVPGCPPSK